MSNRRGEDSSPASSSVPLHLLSNLANNLLTEIPVALLPQNNLQTLYLNANSLQYIASGAFFQLPLLKNLSVALPLRMPLCPSRRNTQPPPPQVSGCQRVDGRRMGPAIRHPPARVLVCTDGRRTAGFAGTHLLPFPHRYLNSNLLTELPDSLMDGTTGLLRL